MTRTVTAAQKQHALQALEIAELEIAKRKQELEEFLESQMRIFRDRQADHIDWLPKHVREMTMREFSQKYNGNVQAAASASAQHKPPPQPIPDADKSSRKRKWVSSIDSGLPESSRAAKNARLDSPSKKPGPPAVHRTRLKSLSRSSATHHGADGAPPTRQSSGIARTMSMLPGSPSPTKWKPPFNSYSRPGSPLKQTASFSHKSHSLVPNSPSSSARPMPSASSFNMPLPPKAPIYPPSRHAHTLPVNAKAPRLKRTSSRIIIRKDTPSSDKRPESSQESLQQSSQTPTEPASSDTSTSSHSRDSGPRTPLQRTVSFTGMVSIPMKGGQQMEFDPFQTSPGELDGLQGVTDSAKKHAKEEMSKLIEATMSKWKIAKLDV